jgi:hypothetical protein
VGCDLQKQVEELKARLQDGDCLVLLGLHGLLVLLRLLL